MMNERLPPNSMRRRSISSSSRSSRARAGDRVLRTEQIEVHDLEELTGLGADLRDEVGDLGVVEPELARPDGGHPIVTAA